MATKELCAKVQAKVMAQIADTKDRERYPSWPLIPSHDEAINYEVSDGLVGTFFRRLPNDSMRVALYAFEGCDGNGITENQVLWRYDVSGNRKINMRDFISYEKVMKWKVAGPEDMTGIIVEGKRHATDPASASICASKAVKVGKDTTSSSNLVTVKVEKGAGLLASPPRDDDVKIVGDTEVLTPPPSSERGLIDLTAGVDSSLRSSDPADGDNQDDGSSSSNHFHEEDEKDVGEKDEVDGNSSGGGNFDEDGGIGQEDEEADRNGADRRDKGTDEDREDHQAGSSGVRLEEEGGGNAVGEASSTASRPGVCQAADISKENDPQARRHFQFPPPHQALKQLHSNEEDGGERGHVAQEEGESLKLTASWIGVQNMVQIHEPHATTWLITVFCLDVMQRLMR
jgi:hypothetical protein